VFCVLQDEIRLLKQKLKSTELATSQDKHLRAKLTEDNSRVVQENVRLEQRIVELEKRVENVWASLDLYYLHANTQRLVQIGLKWAEMELHEPSHVLPAVLSSPLLDIPSRRYVYSKPLPSPPRWPAKDAFSWL